MIKKIFGLVFLCVGFFSNAQTYATNEAPQMADTFRQEGKIYVVITVISIIFLSLVCLLIYIERKLKKIEDKVNERIS